MTSYFAENEEAAAIYRAAEATPAATAADLGLMVGFPAPAATRVTWANWITPPYNRWAFQRVGQIRPTLTVPGAGAPRPLPQDLLDLDGFTFPSLSGGAETLAAHLAATYTDACLILQGGRVRYERYWNGQEATTRHIMFSVTKSIIGLVAEVLIARGILDETALTVRYLPELSNSAFGDATIRQVLDMAVGIDYVEKYDDPDSSSSHYGYASGLLPAPAGLARYASLYEYLPSLQKRGQHGGLFHYVTAVTEVLGWAMERASGQSSDRLVAALLWSKIGVERDAYFAADPWGRAITGAGFNATLRDLGRFGELVLREGRIDGEEILPAVAIRGIAAGGDAAAFARDPEFAAWAPGASYRSQWYVFNEDGASSLMACGIHGQYIFVDFRADLVVVKQSSLPAAESPIGADTVRLLRALARHFRSTRS
jgi:CubicO group peptidase (beta-lactamase class C family)